MDTMEGVEIKAAIGKSLRPVRNRRHSRKTLAVSQKSVKRLFTPEIKRFLKEWLIRRRDNPYPNREEKKQLSINTGLTYIQICNWFANWRRKLKNATKERNKKTWGHLIKIYNDKARGNVEQFSICSEDSIWAEPDLGTPESSSDLNIDHCYTPFSDKCDLVTKNHFPLMQHKSQCYHVSSTTEEMNNGSKLCGNKYKSHIMEKYLKGLESEKKDKAPVLLSKWLQSAVNFQPCQSNYVSWMDKSEDKKILSKYLIKNESKSDYFDRKESNYGDVLDYGSKELDFVYKQCIHGREEVEAAVALTRLATMYRS